MKGASNSHSAAECGFLFSQRVWTQSGNCCSVRESALDSFLPSFIAKKDDIDLRGLPTDLQHLQPISKTVDVLLMFWQAVRLLQCFFCLSDLAGFSNATDAYACATGLGTCIVKSKLSCSCMCDTTRTRGSLIPEPVCLQQASPNFKVIHLRGCRGHNAASGQTRAFSLFKMFFRTWPLLDVLGLQSCCQAHAQRTIWLRSSWTK